MRRDERKRGEVIVYFVDVMVNYEYLTLSLLVCLQHKCTKFASILAHLYVPPLCLCAYFVFKSHWFLTSIFKIA